MIDLFEHWNGIPSLWWDASIDEMKKHYEVGRAYEISEEQYYYFLDILPPLHCQGRPGFFMSEHTHGPVTSHFWRRGEKYFWEYAIISATHPP
ncbi:MAG: DUF1419 domain-containing protein [Gammaproteobacteria bacterium]|nr:DUF1419 domain-containing protein [Gammaproteobacteria bacterium]